MDTVGNPIFFHTEQSEAVMRNACLQMLSDTLDDRNLASAIMDRVSNMMTFAYENNKVPVIARTLVIDNQHIFEIAAFLDNGMPNLFRTVIPDEITAEVSTMMAEVLNVAVGLVDGYTDIAVCQILCQATNDPWALLRG